VLVDRQRSRVWAELLTVVIWYLCFFATLTTRIDRYDSLAKILLPVMLPAARLNALGPQSGPTLPERDDAPSRN
jgi:hypothetical protein